jgi:3-methyl-2-oxobutanoate hydroxymethyltransferase
MKIHDFKKMKDDGAKISVVTCYDYWSAKIIAQSDIDCILVGDSLAMVMHGHSTTIPASIDLMALHIEAVARGAGSKFIIADLPFCSYRKGLVEAMNAVEKLMQAGGHAVKLEGVVGNETLINHIVNSGVPVMGHVGFTPQSIHQLGGFSVQGKDKNTADELLKQALMLGKAGCFAVVLECIPNELAQKITKELSIPTIGIGAGIEVSGQVLVLQDLLGLNCDFKPKFCKTYLNGCEQVTNALNEFNKEVKTKVFPDEQYSWS